MSRPSSPPRSRTLVGNRLVLAGALLYLLEWVAIIGAGVAVPVGANASPHDLADAYAGHADAIGWAAGWFCVVELGRVLLMVGLRSAHAESGRADRLMDAAVAAMAVSVALEIAVYAVASGSAWALGHGGSAGATRSLDAVAFQLNQTIYGPMGISLLCAGIAMWRSQVFSRRLAGLGAAAGISFTVLGLTAVAPRFAGLAGALSAAALPMWAWMVWAGVVTWRARVRTTAVADATLSTELAALP